MPEGRTRGQTTAQTSDAGGVAQQLHFCTSELLLHAFSATPPASGSELSACPRVPPRFARVSPAVTHGAPPPEAALCRCGCGGGAVGEGIHTSIHTIENVREVTIGEVENESIRKSIDDMQGWK